MMRRVPTRQQKVTLVRMETVLEYATRPRKRLGTPAPERTTARPIPSPANTKVGAQIIQCFCPKEMERPIRTCSKVREATNKRQVCRMVVANHSLAVDAGSVAMSKFVGPPMYSLTTCHTKMASAKRSNEASQMWALSA
jgi:hypothetical protein